MSIPTRLSTLALTALGMFLAGYGSASAAGMAAGAASVGGLTMEGVRAIPARVLAPSCVDPDDPACSPPPVQPPPPSTRRFFEVYLDFLRANNTTETGSNDRDEVYMEVMAEIPGGRPVYSRVPRGKDDDDYYGFSTGQEATAEAINTWVSHDGAYMGKPMFYVGSLQDGESVEILVTFQEQDNKSVGAIKGPLVATLNAAALIATDPTVVAVLKGGALLAGQLPETKSDDVIGGFMVRVSNAGGVLTKTWVPTPSIVVARGTATTALHSLYASAISTANASIQQFDMKGTSSADYVANAMVRTVTQAETYEDRPLVYLGEEKDRCGSDNLTLSGVRIPKVDPAVPKGVNVSLTGGDHWYNKGGYFHWECDGVREQTHPDQATEYVIVSRRGSVDDRLIHWYTFKKVAQ